MAAFWFRLSSFNVLLPGVSVLFAGGISTSSSSSVYSARDSIIASGFKFKSTFPSSDKQGVLFVIILVVYVEGQVVGELMSILDVDSAVALL